MFGMSTLDVLILIPVIPLATVAVTSWLPWQRVPWDESPKSFLGPYLFYGAFAAWHFKLGWWMVLLLSVGGTIFSVIAVLEEIKKRKI
jgi:hypothetical protein